MPNNEMRTAETFVPALAERLRKRGWFCATAESCTGGGVAHVLTAVAGSSEWFERGFVVYSNSAKHELLGVSTQMISRYGAVSEPVAQAMAEGTLRASRAATAVAITGIAGPAGGTAEKPVGTVVFAWAAAFGQTRVETRHFPGDRSEIRARSVRHAIEGWIEFLDAL